MCPRLPRRAIEVLPRPPGRPKVYPFLIKITFRTTGDEILRWATNIDHEYKLFKNQELLQQQLDERQDFTKTLGNFVKMRKGISQKT